MNIRHIVAFMACATAITASAEKMSILTEHFDGFKSGSEDTPVSKEVAPNGLISTSMTAGALQWYGRGIHEAGKVCAVMHFDNKDGESVPGWIGSPYTDVRLDNGRFTLRFRARSMSTIPHEGVVYLLDKYTSNYYSINKFTLSSEWKTYEIDLQHNSYGNRLAFVQIGAYDFDWLIDDIEFIQDVYAINPPHGLPPTDVDFTKFTARWESVWSATDYLVYVFSTDNGEPDGKRTYLIQNQPSDTTLLPVTGTVRPNIYYFTVKARNDSYTSEESEPVRVYVPLRSLDIPVLMSSTDITTSSYTAQWKPVDRAFGYAVRHFMRFAPKTTTSHNLVHEDFATITAGTTSYPSRIYDDDLNKYSKLPGWKVNMAWMAKGMVGIDNYYQAYEPGMITSPSLSFLNREGEYTVKLRVYSDYPNDVVNIDSYRGETSQHKEFKIPTAGYHDIAVTFTNGSDDGRFTVTFNSPREHMLFIDDITIVQKVRAGEQFDTPIASFIFEHESKSDTEPVTYTFTNLDNSIEKSYVLQVAAYARELDEEGVWGVDLFSPYCTPLQTIITRNPAEIDNAEADATPSIAIEQGVILAQLPKPDVITIYRTDGSVTFSQSLDAGLNHLPVALHGLYVVTIGTTSFKVMIP